MGSTQGKPSIGSVLPPQSPPLTRKSIKGERYHDGYCERHDFFADIMTYADTRKRSHPIYKCRNTMAPARVDGNCKLRFGFLCPPLMLTEPAVVHLSSIPLDFNKIDPLQCSWAQTHGQSMYRVPYTVETRVFPGENQITFIANAFDWRLGTVELGTATVAMPAP